MGDFLNPNPDPLLMTMILFIYVEFDIGYRDQHQRKDLYSFETSARDDGRKIS